MSKYKEYEEHFTKLGINETEANAVIEYLKELAELSIRMFNEKVLRYEELCNMDKSIN